MDIPTITAVGGMMVIVIGAVSTAAVKIIRAIKYDTRVTVAGQRAGQARGRVRDKKVQEIHLLTNSRLAAALNLIVVMAKREADRTGKAEDLATFKAAQNEVKKVEEATILITDEDRNDEDLVNAKIAEDKLKTLTESVKVH